MLLKTSNANKAMLFSQLKHLLGAENMCALLQMSLADNMDEDASRILMFAECREKFEAKLL